jgi:hypothetical protein
LWIVANWRNIYTVIIGLTNWSINSNEEIFNILAASFSNEKIKWIIEDEDVKEFIGTLYKAKSELVKDDVAEFLNLVV